jgi:hypothetical protein
MAALSSPAILRLSAAAAMPYATVEKITRPLIAAGRWPSRQRRELLAGDLASILNALASLQPSPDAAKIDSIMRRLEYTGTWPTAAEQTPALGERNWGRLLEQLIQNAPPVSDVPSPPTRDPDGVRGHLPNQIETQVNPLSITLTWFGIDGGVLRYDFYQPNKDERISLYPLGKGTFLIRKSILFPNMIILAAEILRDTTAYTAVKNENAALPGAAPTRSQGLAAQNQDDDSKPSSGTSDTPVDKRGRENAQPLSSRRLGPSPQKRRRKVNDGRSRGGATASPVG